MDVNELIREMIVLLRDRHGSVYRRSIVESHGGRLWATDTPSRGATFHVALPANVNPLQ